MSKKGYSRVNCRIEENTALFIICTFGEGVQNYGHRYIFFKSNRKYAL